MKDHYEVTIGIPVYNSIDFIRNTMNSALNQTFSDIEFLIVDDCGNDGTMDVVEYFQNTHPRGNDIRILVNDTNHGVGYSRNRIIEESKGKYLYFLDSDDIIESNTIQLLYKAAAQIQAQVVYGSYDIIDLVNYKPRQKYQKESLVLEGEDTLAMYAFKNNHIFHVSACNCMINKTFLIQTGIRFVNATYWEDMVFTTELVIKVKKAVLLSDFTYHYIWHANSLSQRYNRVSFKKDEIMANISLLYYLKNKAKQLKAKKYIPYFCYNLEMICFYAVCLILKNADQIDQKISYFEMREMLQHPVSFVDILKFHRKIVSNLAFWMIGRFPIPLFLLTIWLLGKFKKAI